MYKLSVILFFLFIGVSSRSQTKLSDSVKYINIALQVAELGKSLTIKDYKTFAKYTYPVLINKLGGEEIFIQKIEAKYEEMSKQGFFLLKTSFGKSTRIISFKTQLQATIQQILEIKYPNGKIISKTTLICISTDNGQNWTFLDSNGKDISVLKKRYPDLSSNLIILKNPDPLIYKE